MDNECAHWAPRRSEADQRRILARTYYAFEIACLSGWLEIPPTPGLEIRGFGHGERRRVAREEVTVVLAIGHALRAHEALSRPDALPGLLEVVHRLFEDGVFVGHERKYTSRHPPITRSLAFSCEQAEYERKRKEKRAG